MVYTDLISIWGIELGLISVSGSESIHFLCIGVENDLALVSGSTLTWIFCDDVRPQIDMQS